MPLSDFYVFVPSVSLFTYVSLLAVFLRPCPFRPPLRMCSLASGFTQLSPLLPLLRVSLQVPFLCMCPFCFPFFTFVSLRCLRMCPFFFYVSPFCFPFYVCLPSGSLFTYVSLLVGLFHRCPFWLPFLPMYPFCSSFYVCVPYFLLLHMCPLCFLFFKRVPSVSLLTCGSAKLKIILSCQFTSRAL